MKKLIFASALLFLGFGCNQNLPVNNVDQVIKEVMGENNQIIVTSTLITNPTSTVVTPKKLAVERSFTLGEIEAKGGVKEWFRQLARANVAGKKTLVRVPVNHIQGFGCLVPVKYCASTITGGCYGPYLDLKGGKSLIDNAPGTLWEVEGYVVAASKVPDYPEEDARSCAEGELIYDFQVTRVIGKISSNEADAYQFLQYK